MTRAELIHQMALMTDDELENCILIYKDGGNTTLLKDYASRLPEDLRELEIKNILNYIKQLHSSNKSTKSIEELVEYAKLENPRFIQRLSEPSKGISFKPSATGKWEVGSHVMSSRDNIVFPSVQELPDGSLIYFDDEDEALQEALKNENYLKFESVEDADNFRLNYKLGWKEWFDNFDEYVDEIDGVKVRPTDKLTEDGQTLYISKDGNLYIKDEVKKHQEGGTLENVNLDLVALELNKPEEPEYKQIKLHKSGGSLIDLLKDQLGDSEIIDLLLNFGIDELMQGGLKNTKSMSISIIIEDDGGHKIPEMRNIEIGDKSYKVEVVSTDEDMEKGLGERESLDKDCGMLFDFGSTQQEVTFNCEEMQFPIDIVFINDEDEVIRVAENCLPGKDLFTESNVRYVLEVNANSKIKLGDELDVDPEEDSPVMKVLAPDGSTQMELQGGERIFSRVKTKQLIKWAKRCNKTKKESDYKHLGTLMFKEIKAQDERKPEYVEVPEN